MRGWYRGVYTLVSAVSALWLMHAIAGAPDRVLWTAPPLARWPLHAIQFASFGFALLAFSALDLQEFLGIAQMLRAVQKRPLTGNIEGITERGLVTDGAYGIVRHPLYVAGIVIISSSPVVTVKGVTVAVLADLYFLFGMIIEERRFLNIFGDQYREYQSRVPMMFPRLWR